MIERVAYTFDVATVKSHAVGRKSLAQRFSAGYTVFWECECRRHGRMQAPRSILCRPCGTRFLFCTLPRAYARG